MVLLLVQKVLSKARLEASASRADLILMLKILSYTTGVKLLLEKLPRFWSRRFHLMQGQKLQRTCDRGHLALVPRGARTHDLTTDSNHRSGGKCPSQLTEKPRYPVN